ncbi:MAG: hypothetical protein L0H96_11950 [Humibacillus sp.]|nr:hypothetical protein [Humibacillus sp.]MDN5777617.1 hypothetical protein [Humibacillus sp.]
MQDQHRISGRLGVAAAAFAVMAVGAACSASSAAPTTAGAPPTSSQSASATSAGGRPPTIVAPASTSSNVLTIVESEWKYQISGAPQAGLVTPHVSNVGEKAHDLELHRVKNGVTLKKVAATLNQNEAEAASLMTDPDQQLTSAAISGAQTSEEVVVALKAGHYVGMSFLPTSAGGLQVARGMVAEFTVLPAAAGPAPEAPVTAGTVQLTDTGIRLPAHFAAGGTFEVKNVGTKPHDLSLAKLKGAPLPAYFQCIAQSFSAGTEVDACPGTLQGGVSTLQPGQSAYATLAFGPGTFGYVSTQGEGADFQAGLNGTFSNS